MTPYHRSIRKFLHTYAPFILNSIQTVRRNLHDRRAAKHAKIRTEITEQFVVKYGCEVQAGPFKGMKYIRGTTGSPFLPKLVGSYERELWGVIENIVVLNPPVLIDIGCDEGYYAVGFSRRLTSSKVYAFDTNERAQSLCAEMARLNGLERNIVVGGLCMHEELNRLIVPNALVFSDCEGFELELFDPVLAPALLKANILVELHDFIRSDREITPTLCERFRQTHDISFVNISNRNPDDFASLNFLPVSLQKIAIEEYRVKSQQWAFMTPKPA